MRHAKARPTTRRWARWRDRLRERPVADLVYRIVVGVVGLVVLAVGILAIPYPGPGWAIVFIGLGDPGDRIRLGRNDLLASRQARYDAAMDWFTRGIAGADAGGRLHRAVVVATLWLLGALGWPAELVGIEWPWLKSPIGMGS